MSNSGGTAPSARGWIMPIRRSRAIASEIIAIAMEEGFDHLDAPVLRVCDEDVPLPYAANLEKLALITPAKIVEAVRKVCYR